MAVSPIKMSSNGRMMDVPLSFEIASALSTHPEECNSQPEKEDCWGLFGPLDTRCLFEVPDPLLCGSCSGYHFGGAKEKRKQKSKVLGVEICCLAEC